LSSISCFVPEGCGHIAISSAETAERPGVMLNVFDLEMLGTQQETAVTGYTREKDLSFKPFWNLKN